MEEIKASLKRIQREIDGLLIECDVCNESPVLWRRVTVKNLKEIVEQGEIKPSRESGVISLSANPLQPYGGAIRLAFNKVDLPPMRQMGYMPHEPREAYYALRSKTDELAKKFYEADPTIAGYNRADAVLGVTSESYKNECEHYTDNPISTDKIKEIEYTVHQGAPPPLEEFSVSCKRRSPRVVDGTGWSGMTWDKQLENIKEVRQAAEKLEVPFKVRSCFPLVSFGWKGRITLTDENLQKMERGEEVPVEPKAMTEDDYYKRECKC